MKILSRKLTAIVMLAIFAVSAFAIGFVSMVYKPAIADQSLLPSNTVYKNIEDIIDDLAVSNVRVWDRLHVSGTGGTAINMKSGSELNGINQIYEGAYNRTALYTVAQRETDKCNYTKTGVSEDSNMNVYDGNISVYSATKDKSTYNITRLYFQGKYDSFDIPQMLTLRLQYFAGTSYTFYERTANNENGAGHIFNLSADGSIVLGRKNNTNTYTVDELLATVQQTNPTATALYEDGDSLIITFGTYLTGTSTEDGNTNYYLKIYNETKGYVSVEVQVAKDYYRSTQSYCAIWVQSPDYTARRINIAGVNEPILNPIKKTLTINTDLDNVQSLADVKLPENYTFSQPETVVNGLTSAIAQFDYYGKKTDCVVNVAESEAIEDLIDGIDNISWRINRTNVSGENIEGTRYKYENNLNSLHYYTNPAGTTKFAWALYTTDEVANTNVEYTKNSTSELATENININANKYAGNFSFFSTETQECMLYFYNDDANARNRIVSLRTNFENNSALIMRASVTNTANLETTDASYSIELIPTSATICKGDSVASTNALQKYIFNTPIEFNDELILTYGAYDIDQNTYVYVNIYNVTKGCQVIDETYIDALDTAEKETYTVAYRLSPQFQTADKNVTPVTIAGVNQPLLGYDYAIAEELSADNVGKSVSTLTLKDGYAIADATQVLTVGENKVKVNYTGEYYGSTKTVSAIVTVNVKANNVTIKDMAGADIQTAQVGSSFTLPTLDRAKMFVAYKAQDGKLYKQGETVEVSSDCSFTLTEVDVLVLEKIEIRLSTVDNRFGGLRFTAKILTADLDKLAGSEMTVKSLIVPAGIEDFSGAQELVNTFEDGDYTYAYFTVTNLNYYNFNRQFTGSLIIYVPYESGNDYAVSNVVSGSAYDIASELLAQNVEARANGQALFNGTAEEIISRYAYGVIDLTYIENTLSYSNTLSNAWFELNGVENESVEDGVYSATVKVNVLEGANGFITDDNYSAPVIVRVGDGYKVAVVSARTLESGVLSLNIQVKIA